MKVYLLYPDRDFNPQAPLPWQTEALEQDLGLTQIYDAMAADDKYLRRIARRVLSQPLDDPEHIHYRQAVLADVLQHTEVVQALYRLPLEAQRRKREQWLGIFSRSPAGILSSAVDLLAMLTDLLRTLKAIADEHAPHFTSEGFHRFFASVQSELDATYFAEIAAHLQALKLRKGVLLSAELGPGNEAANYTLRKPLRQQKPLLRQIFERQPSCGFTIPPRDTHGSQALGTIKDRGLNAVANAVAQSAEHIDNFFKQLQAELAFYLGAANLAQQIARWEMPFSFPNPQPPDAGALHVRGLYDLSLALVQGRAVVGNDLNADGKKLTIISGANRGGKTTFLRAVGLAHLLMQVGMFVPAQSMRASITTGVFTHFKREEDDTMESGKFDEELARLSAIVEHLSPHSLLLCNESFAATNEREGSAIARQVVDTLIEHGIRVFFVTHFYEFAQAYRGREGKDVLFLRAERLPDGRRTFRLLPAPPLPTSFAADVYRRVFGEDA